MPATTAASARAAARHLLAALGLAVALAAPALTARTAAASLLDEPPKRTSFNLNDTVAPKLPLLGAFRNAAVERPGPLRVYLSGAYGQWEQKPWWQLAWGAARSSPVDDADGAPDAPPFVASLLRGDPLVPGVRSLFTALDAGAEGPLRLTPDVPTWLRRLDPSWSPPVLASTGPSLSSDGFDTLWAPPKDRIPSWRCRPRVVHFARLGGQHDAFQLLRCDGSVAPGALDRLSIMARPPGAPDPGEQLPDEPDADAWRGALEWVPKVRLLHPRLLWLLQQVADAFPRRMIYIYSGYRPRAASAASEAGARAPGGSSHHSQHAKGRAMDIAVTGVPNAALFGFCRTLEDVGCGFYPNSKFVHVDVRRPGTGHLSWIDISAPGEPSKYVDTWSDGGGVVTAPDASSEAGAPAAAR